MYTWYKATKKFKLVRKGATTIVKPGESVGVRAAGSSKDKMRLVLDSLGVNKVFSFFKADWPKMQKNLKAVNKKEADQVVNVSTPNTQIKASIDWKKFHADFVASPAKFANQFENAGEVMRAWYGAGNINAEGFRKMAWLRHYFLLSEDIVWGYRGTQLEEHGRKVAIKTGDFVRLNVMGTKARPFQSWSHAFKTAKRFKGDNGYILKAQIPTKLIVTCPAMAKEALAAAVKLKKHLEIIAKRDHKPYGEEISLIGQIKKNPSPELKARLREVQKKRKEIADTYDCYRSLKKGFEGIYKGWASFKHEEEMVVAVAGFKKGVRCEVLYSPEE